MPGSVFHLIPHTHWDREWYQPRAAFVARLVPMMDDLIARLEADPSFSTFLLDGQTILIEDYLGVRPDRTDAVRSLVGAGRLQTGPWYVLADELIPSGESLVRNLLIGSAQARALGDRSRVLYSPDAFGHPAAWPSLGREFGIEHGVLWRGRSGDRDLFRWRAPDGAEIVVYHLPPAGYEIGAALPADAERLARDWPPIRAALLRRAATRHVAVFVGADHHAAHPDLPGLRRLLGALEPESDVRISRLDEFVAAAAAAAAAAADGAPLPQVEGELRTGGHTWVLQGVHATRAPLKRRNAVCELWLARYAEPLALLARRAGGSDRRPLLGVAWRTLVQSHFHDALGGCCADAVAADVVRRQDAVLTTARELTRASAAELAGYDPDRARDERSSASPALVCWNPAARPREGVVIADVTFFRRDVLVGPPSGRAPRRGGGYAPFAFRAADGRRIPVQVLEGGRGLERLDAARHYPDLDEVDRVRVAFEMPRAGGMALSALTPVASRAKAAGAVSVAGRTLSNETLDVTLEPDGTVTVRDRSSGERYLGLLRLESDGDAGDTYTFAPVAGSLLTTRGLIVRARTVARGPLAGAIEATWTFAGVRARLRLILLAGERFVRCALELDNHATNRRLRARLPVGIASRTAVAGTSFGAIERPVEPAGSTPAEAAVSTSPAHRYVAAAHGERGIAVFAPGFFEYEWTGRDTIVTLLRSVGDLSRGDLATRPGHAGWVTPTPGAQCIGADHVDLAIGPANAADLAESDRLERRWEDAFLPMRGMWLRDAGELAPLPAGVELEGEGLVVSAAKPAEDGDGMILRCCNSRGAVTAGRWRLQPPPRYAERSAADERAGETIPVEADGSVPFGAGPREIVTVRIR